MDHPKRPNFRRLAIIGLLFIMVSTMLLFWARDVVREVVVLPLSYLVWVIGILVDLTPQFYFWIVVLVITFLIAYPSLSRKKKQPLTAPTTYAEEMSEQVASGRTQYWMNKVILLRSGRGIFYTRTFHIALGRLLVDMLAYRYRLSTRLVEDRLRDGSLDLPRDVREFALESLNPLDVPQGSIFAWWWAQLRAQFLDIARSVSYRLQDAYRNFRYPASYTGPAFLGDTEAPRASRDDPRVINVIKYIEDELEVRNDDTGR